MVFLNHFQLPDRYNAGTEFLSTFQQYNTTHISDHIKELHKQKRLIKANIRPGFLLEWFLKSLFPFIVKDVLTYGVAIEKHTIF